MKEVKKYILSQVARNEISKPDAKKLLLELNAASTNSKMDIAIVGMSGKFPQSENIDAFWEHLRDGISCIDEYPEQRRKDAEHVLKNPIYMEYLTGSEVLIDNAANPYAAAGYMEQIDQFDADFFGIPPAEATYMDPNQRLIMETCWEAMEDAGYGGQKLFGTDTGVYIGREGTNISQYRYATKPDPMQLTGSWESIIASRLSYLFDFHGPCMLVDTACSGSLVSIHMACKAIQSGECRIALAGGVNIVHGELKPEYQGGMNMSSVESEDSLIRTFDANANGTVWGEGVGMVMLKSLELALKDGDNVHAIIKGSAVNNDGASNALTSPNAESQEAVIIKAWEDAGIDPQTLDYIEAHGTGTVLGDPIEYKGLSNAFRRYTDKKQFCAIGSLKTNIGHLVASSGLASLVKVIKSIQNDQVAPTINFNEPNPYIDFSNSPLYVADTLTRWPESETPKRAALSSFGFNKTNCHMVVEEAPKVVTGKDSLKHHCLVVSAKKKELLKDYIEKYTEYCDSASWNLADLCYTAASGRGHYDHRVCIFADNKQTLKNRLSRCVDVIEGGSVDGIFYGTYKVVSDRKKTREDSELTEFERTEYSKNATKALEEFKSTAGMSLEQLQEAAQYYCKGGNADFSIVYEGEERKRLSQPTYPFEKRRMWADPKVSKARAAIESKLHPLVDFCTSYTDSEWHFESTFANHSHWVLADHKIKNTGVVPGTTYLEMARFLAEHALKCESVEFRNLYFLQPMVVEEGSERTVSSSLIKTEHGYQYSVKSVGDDQLIQEHVEADLFPISDISAEVVNLDDIKDSSIEKIDNYISESDTGVFQFGPHWDCIRTAWRGEENALAELSLPHEYISELDQFKLHPSVLDNAMNLLSQSTGETFLPYLYKSFKLYKPFEKNMYSVVTPNSALSVDDETHSYHVKITDTQGLVIAESEKYITKKVHNFDFQERSGSFDYLKIRWAPFFSEQTSKPLATGPILIVASTYEDIEYLGNSFRAEGVDVRLVILENVESELTSSKEDIYVLGTSKESIDKFLISRFCDDISGIVFAADYNRERQYELIANPDLLAGRKSQTIDALFYFTKTILESKKRLDDGIVLLSSDGYSVSDNNSVASYFASACGIYALSFGMETSGIDVRVLDVSTNSDLGTINSLLGSLPVGKIHALRNNEIYTRELHSTNFDDEQNSSETSSIKEGGVYLVTGGLGGLGISAANYIASQAKATVILVGRSSLPDASQWVEIASGKSNQKETTVCASLAAIRKDLTALEYHQVDVTERDQVVDLVENIRSTHGCISGVFHAAGIAGDGFIVRKDYENFNNVLAAKIDGTINLMSSLSNETLDFVVLYSSITAALGGEGQSDYAAANAFMDAISHSRALTDIPVVSVNWPSWSEVGMTIDFEMDVEMTPFEPLTNEQAFEKLETLLRNETSMVIPADINPDIFIHIKDQLSFSLAPELASKLLQTGVNTTDSNVPTTLIDVQILGKSEDELSETEKLLANVYGNVLGVEEIDVFTNFQDMGGNSILATHLLKVVEESYPNIIDISDIFSYPSIDQIAEYIDEALGQGTSSPMELDEPEDWDSLVSKIKDGERTVDSLLEEI